MKILVACEESQTVTIELRKLGHEAYSCDLQECSGGHQEWHIKADVLEIIKLNWDMIIAHPPCTYLTSASAVRLYNKDHTIKDPERYAKGLKAKKFFLAIWNADCPRIAIENPTPIKEFGLPQYSQIIEPYYFGDPWRKRTCLWLRNLPQLLPTEVVEPKGLWVGATSGRRDASVYSRYSLRGKRDQKERSKTFTGIAKAMAEQWAGLCEEVQECRM